MMRRFIYLFLAIALLCGCEREDMLGQLQGVTAGDAASMGIPEELYAAMADDDHRERALSFGQVKMAVNLFAVPFKTQFFHHIQSIFFSAHAESFRMALATPIRSI